MLISAIVATAENNVIGKDNQIPWHLSADLKYFKKTTTGHHILMGRKSYESIGKPLPNRVNLILTSDKNYKAEGCVIISSIEEGIAIAKAANESELFIIGGGTIYEQTQPLWDKLYLTEVHINPEGDVFFPEVDLDNWTPTFIEPHEADEKNKMDYTFKVFEKNENI